MIDTHTHLYLPEFEADGKGSEAVMRALEVGVSRMIFPNVDISTIAPMKELAAQFSDAVSMAMGLHPTEVHSDWRDPFAVIEHEWSSHPDSYVAVGEIGIDMYWDKTFEKEQMEAFDTQVKYAKEHSLPIIIHCREGLPQVLEVLTGHPGVEGVFHSFCGTSEDVQSIRRVGDFYFGINGVVTFKNSKLKNSLSEIGLSRLLLETDAPYLAPVPFRGKRNESAYVMQTAQFVANHLNITLDHLDSATTSNAYSLFKFH